MNKEEKDQYLIDSWCEINGGGIVTQDQIDLMRQVTEAILQDMANMPSIQ